MIKEADRFKILSAHMFPPFIRLRVPMRSLSTGVCFFQKFLSLPAWSPRLVYRKLLSAPRNNIERKRNQPPSTRDWMEARPPPGSGPLGIGSTRYAYVAAVQR